MCGIIGYVGKEEAASLLIEGLKRLEYRGYDSAGLVVHDDDGFHILRKTGRVEVLAGEADNAQLTGRLGISHTRWATHGNVTEANTHPHMSSDGKIALVHNGVIENYIKMSDFIKEEGYIFF